VLILAHHFEKDKGNVLLNM